LNLRTTPRLRTTVAKTHAERPEPIQHQQPPTSPHDRHLYDILPYITHFQRKRLENSQRSRRNLHTGSYSTHNTDPNPSHLFKRHIHKSLLKLRLDMISHGRTQHNGTARVCAISIFFPNFLSYLSFLYEWAFVRYGYSSFHMNGASWAMEFQIKMNS